MTAETVKAPPTSKAAATMAGQATSSSPEEGAPAGEGPDSLESVSGSRADFGWVASHLSYSSKTGFGGFFGSSPSKIR
ncbi:MAG: hypothetical protein BUE48_003030 [Thermomonospora sp. CIF 1]|nr:MAG: hypothetical protein BUE48_003030 [Thermomonospora sp. CIF 1]